MQPQANRVFRAPENDVLRAMFAARKEVFIDLLKWDLPVLAGAYEVDQFDNPDAKYLILAQEDGTHCASARILRTDRPHLLGEYYFALCHGPVPTGPTTREITRFCLDRHQSSAERRSARNQLVTALAEHALLYGITDYTGVAELSWFTQIEQFGWQCRRLGPVLPLGQQKLVALHIRIDEQTIEGLMSKGIYEPASLCLFAPVGGHA